LDATFIKLSERTYAFIMYPQLKPINYIQTKNQQVQSCCDCNNHIKTIWSRPITHNWCC